MSAEILACVGHNTAISLACFGHNSDIRWPQHSHMAYIGHISDIHWPQLSHITGLCQQKFWPASATTQPYHWPVSVKILACVGHNTCLHWPYHWLISATQLPQPAFPDSWGPGNLTGSAQCAGSGNGSIWHTVVPLCGANLSMLLFSEVLIEKGRIFVTFVSRKELLLIALQSFQNMFAVLVEQ